MTSMYFVTASDMNGDDRSFFVSAVCPEDAARMWAKQWIEEFGSDELSDDFDTLDEVRVFRVPANEGVPHLHPWTEPTTMLIGDLEPIKA